MGEGPRRGAASARTTSPRRHPAWPPHRCINYMIQIGAKGGKPSASKKRRVTHFVLCLARLARSPHQLADRLAVVEQLHGPAGEIHHLLFGVDAQGVVERAEH